MTDPFDGRESFDEAITQFLNEHVPPGAENVNWNVDVDNGDNWEVRLWVNDGDYLGRFRVTAEGSELLEKGDDA